MMLKDNPAYQLIFHSEVHNVDFFQPVDMANGYHTSRYIAAGTQNIYSASGATKDYLQTLSDKMLEIVNTGNKKTIISDIAILCNNLQYRLKTPIDEDCAIRMGAIYCIAEGEEPNEMSNTWMRRKMDWCKGADAIKADHNLYDVFFSTGVMLTPAWSGLLTDSEQMDSYLSQRNEVLRTLTLEASSPL